MPALLSALSLFEKLSRWETILHFVSKREGGVSASPYDSLNLGFSVGDEPQAVVKNRELLATSLRMPLGYLTFANQVHGNQVAVLNETDQGKGSVTPEDAITAADAMVTNVPRICLAILVADCVPLLFYDPKQRVVGAAHAGWRGTMKKIGASVVKTFIEQFGSDPSDIMVGIGPSIGPCCYEVGPKVIADAKTFLGDKRSYIQRKSPQGKGYFDLWKANYIQLIEMGVLPEQVEVAQLCTRCHANQFFSARHAAGATGRFAAGMMLRG